MSKQYGTRVHATLPTSLGNYIAAGQRASHSNRTLRICRALWTSIFMQGMDSLASVSSCSATWTGTSYLER